MRCFRAAENAVARQECESTRDWKSVGRVTPSHRGGVFYRREMGGERRPVFTRGSGLFGGGADGNTGASFTLAAEVPIGRAFDREPREEC